MPEKTDFGAFLSFKPVSQHLRAHTDQVLLMSPNYFTTFKSALCRVEVLLI